MNVQSDSEILKLLEITKIQRDGFEQQVKLRDDRLAAKDDRLAAKDEIITQLRQQLEDAKANRKDQTAINTGDTRILQACEKRLTEANAEIQRLRHPSFLSRIFKPDTLVAGGFGFFLGRATAPAQGFIQVANPFQQFTKQGFSEFQLSSEERVRLAFKATSLRR